MLPWRLLPLLLLLPLPLHSQTYLEAQKEPHLHSPCPAVFSYEGRKSEKDRWYGVILVSTPVSLSGLRLDVLLDHYAHLLGNWEGEVSSKDNIHFTIWNPNKKLYPGPPLTVRIFVKFDEKGTIPHLTSVRLNGREICHTNTEPLTSRPAPHLTQSTPPHYPQQTQPTRRTTQSVSQAVTPRPTRTTADTYPTRRTTTTNYPTRRTTTTTRAPPPVNRPTSTASGCGKINIHLPLSVAPLITHGQTTSRGQWPWHVALYKSQSLNLSYICGGSLISKKAVITAAHCVTKSFNGRPVDEDSLLVYLGKYHLELWTEGGVQNKQVDSIHVHPSYNHTNFRGDLAVLILRSHAEFSDYVSPVCLWEQRNDLTDIVGKDGVVIGWGFNEHGKVTESLMMARMPVVSNEVCLRSYPQFFPHFTSSETFCAGFRNGTSVCNGDSGGGMVFPRGNGIDQEWHLRGIVSISVSRQDKRVCDTNHYVVFTDISKFVDWIRGIM